MFIKEINRGVCVKVVRMLKQAVTLDNMVWLAE